MRRLPLPNYTVGPTVDLCVQSIQNVDISGRLAGARATISAAETTYLRLAQDGQLFTIPIADAVAAVSKAEMKKIYKDTFAKSVRTRPIYDFIKKQPTNDVCPICGQRTVSSLDHYLAQNHHPSLVVVSANLVPACLECNKAKSDVQPASAEEQTLHPYFDDIDDIRWLFASVQEQQPAALIFSAMPGPGWSTTKAARLLRHFQTFDLGALYAAHAAVELANIRYGLQLMAQSAAASRIRDHLLVQAESCRRVQLNSWQTATYEALASSDWYCNGGFN